MRREVLTSPLGGRGFSVVRERKGRADMATVAEVLGKIAGTIKDAAGIEHPVYPLTLDDVADLEAEHAQPFIQSIQWLLWTAQGHRAVLWRSMRTHGLTDAQIEAYSASGEWPISMTRLGRMFLAGASKEIVKIVPAILKASGYEIKDNPDPSPAAGTAGTATGSPTSSTPPSVSDSLPAKSGE